MSGSPWAPQQTNLYKFNAILTDSIMQQEVGVRTSQLGSDDINQTCAPFHWNTRLRRSLNSSNHGSSPTSSSCSKTGPQTAIGKHQHPQRPAHFDRLPCHCSESAPEPIWNFVALLLLLQQFPDSTAALSGEPAPCRPKNRAIWVCSLSHHAKL